MKEVPEQTTESDVKPLSAERLGELQAMLGDGGKRIDRTFLDSVASLAELEQIESYLSTSGLAMSDGTKDWIDYYREGLRKWPNPENELGQVSDPLLGKLDTPQKARAFLRFADFCELEPYDAAAVLNKIIAAHEGGDEVVVSDQDGPTTQYRGKHFTGRYRRAATILASYTQVEVLDARRLFLPGLKSSGQSGDQSEFDWGKKE